MVASLPGRQLLEVDDVRKAEQRLLVLDGAEAVGRRRADALRRGIGGAEVGVLLLDALKLAEELVVLGVADFGIVEDVVAVEVMRDDAAELFGARGGLRLVQSAPLLGLAVERLNGANPRPLRV